MLLWLGVFGLCVVWGCCVDGVWLFDLVGYVGVGVIDCWLVGSIFGVGWVAF